MLLKLTIEGEDCSLDVPHNVIEEGRAFFDKMDADMDKGWQMSHSWIEHPTKKQRCQIAADRLLQALLEQNKTLLLLMAGYILDRMPKVREVRVYHGGDMNEHEIIIDDRPT